MGSSTSEHQNRINSLQSELREEEKKRRQEQQRYYDQLRKQEEKARQQQQRYENEIALMKSVSRRRAKILTKRPGGLDYFDRSLQFPTRLNVSLFGETGIGKTSLINSLKYAVSGKLDFEKIEQTAPAGYQGAHTIESMEVVLTDYLSVIDNRGINTESSVNTTTQNEVLHHMEGRGLIIWQSSSSGQRKESDKKSYGAVLVFSAHNPEVVTHYESFIQCLRNWLGRFPLAVITHVDEESPVRARTVLEGMGIGDIYEVANITHERDELSVEHEDAMLRLLEKCFKDGDRIFLHRRGVNS